MSLNQHQQLVLLTSLSGTCIGNTDFGEANMPITEIVSQEVIQTLWSGYGEIIRCQLRETGKADLTSVIVKYIQFPDNSDPRNHKHPRGWDTGLSHERKVKSYEVETQWYRDFSQHCDVHCRVAQCYSASVIDEGRMLILEDLDTAGFSARYTSLNHESVQRCLIWLANFHARFMNEKPTGLWPEGTYWHLATRPDEYAVMPSGKLKSQAINIDQKLKNCEYQTILHGDAKVANFCFSTDGMGVAAVDFQYVGRGCGMKDVVYLLGSCLTEKECEQWEKMLLNTYFNQLEIALNRYHKTVDWAHLKSEWMRMFSIAWADFYRFLNGWMPTHKKINAYGQRLTDDAITHCESLSNR